MYDRPFTAEGTAVANQLAVFDGEQRQLTFVSGLPDAELCERIRSTKLPTYTSRSITDPEALIKEVRLTRQRGWSRDDQEHEPGIRCIAAPIYDYRGNIIAAVSTAGLKQIITPARDEEIAGFVMDAALSISRRMGYRD